MLGEVVFGVGSRRGRVDGNVEVFGRIGVVPKGRVVRRRPGRVDGIGGSPGCILVCMHWQDGNSILGRPLAR